VLGALGAQTAALRTRHASALLSNGAQLASTLAERMRANPGPMRTDLNNPYLGLRYNSATDAAPAPPALCFAGGACSAAQLAAFDLYEIKQALYQGFPGGRVAVCRDAKPWNRERAALSWDCTATAGAPIVIKLGWHARLAVPADLADLAAHAVPDAPALVIVLAGATE
jgi:type IV pilus assembly protein PilV